MKTRNFFTLAFLMIAFFGLVMTGCKKDKTESKADSTSLQQLSNDEENINAITNEEVADVNTIMSSGNLKSTETLPCNATIDSTVVANDTITIYVTYNGLNCAGTKFRTGKVEIRRAFQQPWYIPGTTIRVKHINFTITKVATGKTIVLNSVKWMKNVSGGVIWQLGNQVTSIVHRIWGHATITFDDNTTRIWKVARQKTFTGTPPQNITVTDEGFGIAEGYENLVVWGVNRQGENFYTQILEPVSHRQVCGWDPCVGVKKHQIPGDSKSATLTFGYDANNQPVTGTDCPAKFKLDWQKNGQSGTVYLWL